MAQIETAPQQEQPPKHLWVPMRRDVNGGPHSEEYGQLSWRQGGILYGRNLEIDVMAANRLIRAYSLDFPIAIEPYSTRERPEVDVSSVSKDGAATMSQVSSVPNKVDNDRFFYSPIIGKGYALVNFMRIAEQVEARLKGGVQNPNFYPAYGTEVNKALTRSIAGGIIFNATTKENVSVVGVEFWHTVIAAAPSLGFALIKIFADLSSEQLMYAGGASLALAEMFHLMLTSMKIPQNPETEHVQKYKDYLVDHLNRRDFGPLFYPKKLTEKVIAPFAMSYLPKEQLVRGVANSEDEV